MKYIIDLMDDLRESLHNAQGYALVAMLLKESDDGTLRNAGEKRITSLTVDPDAKALYLGFAEGEATTTTLLECVNALPMEAMMYEVMVRISQRHPLMPVIGFGEDREQKTYVFFVTA
jgi:hypothetical protein